MHLIGQAHQVCFKDYMELLFAGTPLVIVDNTNMQRWEMENYKFLAEQLGYQWSTKSLISKDTTIAEIQEAAARGKSPEATWRQAMNWEE